MTLERDPQERRIGKWLLVPVLLACAACQPYVRCAQCGLEGQTSGKTATWRCGRCNTRHIPCAHCKTSTALKEGGALSCASCGREFHALECVECEKWFSTPAPRKMCDSCRGEQVKKIRPFLEQRKRDLEMDLACGKCKTSVSADGPVLSEGGVWKCSSCSRTVLRVRCTKCSRVNTREAWGAFACGHCGVAQGCERCPHCRAAIPTTGTLGPHLCPCPACGSEISFLSEDEASATCAECGRPVAVRCWARCPQCDEPAVFPSAGPFACGKCGQTLTPRRCAECRNLFLGSDVSLSRCSTCEKR